MVIHFEKFLLICYFCRPSIDKWIDTASVIRIKHCLKNWKLNTVCLINRIIKVYQFITKLHNLHVDIRWFLIMAFNCFIILDKSNSQIVLPNYNSIWYFLYSIAVFWGKNWYYVISYPAGEGKSANIWSVSRYLIV